jgi:cell division protein FtsL
VINRLNVVLLVAVIVSAVYLVRVSYDSRRLYSAKNTAEKTAVQLRQEEERLDLERRFQGTHARVDKLARERLQMRNVTPAITEYVDDPGRREVRP